MKSHLKSSVDCLDKASKWIINSHDKITPDIAAVAVPYLRLLGIVCGGWLLIKSALIACKQNLPSSKARNFAKKKLISAHFYCNHFLIQTKYLEETVISGGKMVNLMSKDDF